MVHDEDGKNIWDVDLPESEFSGVHLYVPPPPERAVEGVLATQVKSG